MEKPVVALILGSLIGAVTIAEAAVIKGQVNRRIITVNGYAKKPVPFARVVLESNYTQQRPTWRKSVYSDAQGNYSLPVPENILATVYTVCAEKFGDVGRTQTKAPSAKADITLTQRGACR
jgi:hypothetical protein